MLYVNAQKHLYKRELSFGELKGITMGEDGRGRKEIFLPVSSDVETMLEGLHQNLTIATSQSGRPKIIEKKENDLYLILTSSGGYTRRGDGTICVFKDHAHNVELLYKAWGADGDAGRIGTWDECLFKVTSDKWTIFRIRWSGGNPSEILIVKGTEIHSAKRGDIPMMFDSLGIDMPFQFDSEYIFSNGDWRDVI